MAIYDTTGKVGITKAYKQYFERLKDLESEKEGKKSSRKLGIASAKGVKEFSDFVGPSKLTVDSKSIFEPSAPTGNLFERIGQRALGPDLTKVELTKEATEAGYAIGKVQASGKVGPNPIGTVKPGGGYTQFSPSGKPVALTKGGETVSTQYGGAGTKIGGLLGAYQIGSGLSTAFDPHASDVRKVAGGVNVALGANALLGFAGANLWNPLGLGAGIVGGAATLADIFG